MIINGIANQLIKGLPSYLGGEGIIPSRQEMLRVVEIPSCHYIINFNDDIWDARAGFVMCRRTQNKILFTDCNPQIKGLVKGYAAAAIDDGTKISTLHATIRLLYKALNRSIELNERNVFRFVSTGNIVDAINELYKYSDYDRSLVYTLVIRFISFLQNDAGIILRVDIEKLKEDKLTLDKEINAYRKHRHIPDIPDDLFDLIVNMFDEVMRDESLPLNDRILAGILLLNSQIGLRISEIPAIEIDCRSHYLCSDGQNRPFITYNSIKAARGDVESLPVRTFCNNIADETIDYLFTLRKKCIYADNTDFMLVLDPRGGCNDGIFPVETGAFCSLYKRLMGRYLRTELKKDWAGITKVKIDSHRPDSERFSIPSLHSYRKHFVSAHAKAGTPLDFIDCAMSHTPQEDDWDSYGVGVLPPNVNEWGQLYDKDEVLKQRNLFDSHMKKLIDPDENE